MCRLRLEELHALDPPGLPAFALALPLWGNPIGHSLALPTSPLLQPDNRDRGPGADGP